MNKLFDGLRSLLPPGLAAIDAAYAQFVNSQDGLDWPATEGGISAKELFSADLAAAKDMAAHLEDGLGLALKECHEVCSVDTLSPPLRANGVIYCPGDPFYDRAAESLSCKVIPSVSLGIRGSSLNHQSVLDCLCRGSYGWISGTLIAFLSVISFGYFAFVVAPLVFLLIWLGLLARARYQEWLASYWSFPLPVGSVSSKEIWFHSSGNRDGCPEAEWVIYLLGAIVIVALVFRIVKWGEVCHLLTFLGVVGNCLGLWCLYVAWNGIRGSAPFLPYWKSSVNGAMQFDVIASCSTKGDVWRRLGAFLVVAWRLNLPLSKLTFEAVVSGVYD